MEIKDKSLGQPPLRQPADGGGSIGEPEKTNSLLQQLTNNFLINYFGYLTLVLSFIIFAAGCFLFVYPQYQRISKENETADKNLQADYEAKTSYLSAIRDLKNSYQLVSAADRKKIEDMAPVGNEAVNLIPEIESIVLKNGAVLNSIKIGADVKSQSNAVVGAGPGGTAEAPAGIFGQLPEGAGLIKIEIDLSSVNYPVLKNLLKTFENNARLMDVANVSYDVQGNKAVFTIYAYYLAS